jgi:hypothetical protein
MVIIERTYYQVLLVSNIITLYVYIYIYIFLFKCPFFCIFFLPGAASKSYVIETDMITVYCASLAVFTTIYYATRWWTFFFFLIFFLLLRFHMVFVGCLYHACTLSGFFFHILRERLHPPWRNGIVEKKLIIIITTTIAAAVGRSWIATIARAAADNDNKLVHSNRSNATWQTRAQILFASTEWRTHTTRGEILDHCHCSIIVVAIIGSVRIKY